MIIMVVKCENKVNLLNTPVKTLLDSVLPMFYSQMRKAKICIIEVFLLK